MNITIQYLTSIVLKFLKEKSSTISFWDFKNLLKEEDFNLDKIFDSVDLQKQLFSECLKGLNSIVTTVGDVGILKAPLSQFNQTVNINGELAGELASFLNKLAQKVTKDPSTIMSDPLNIIEDDIRILLQFCVDFQNSESPESYSNIDGTNPQNENLDDDDESGGTFNQLFGLN